jgi:uncharacterized protein YcsI (UPF0317 family)
MIIHPQELRAQCRSGAFTGYTAAHCAGFVQANICILPRDWAYDFLLYCQRNPKPCPLLATSEPGSWHLDALGADIDIRRDLPAYHVFREGEFAGEFGDLSEFWRDDFVTFAMGCSFSFEQALLEDGLPLRYLERGSVAGVYETTVATTPAGRYTGPLLVTMRPFSPSDAIRAIQITSRFPNVHGAPVHLGDPAAIGVDLTRRYCDVGDASVGPSEIPLFWACGLTPQKAVAAARPPIFITHAPSSMLVTDLCNSQLASF